MTERGYYRKRSEYIEKALCYPGAAPGHHLQYPTPFHLYDEKGIRDTARALYKAFSWNPGYREFFAVKATPNPPILKM